MGQRAGEAGPLRAVDTLLRSVAERYVSASVANRLLESGHDPFAETGGIARPAVVLCAELTGLEPIPQGLQPSAVVELLRRVAATVKAAGQRHEGATLDGAGVRMTIAFGVPFEPADPVRAALVAARDMLLSAAPILAEWRSQHGVEVGLRVGIAKGPVIAGNTGNELHVHYQVIGDAVKAAQGTALLARPGELACDAGLHQAGRQLKELLAESRSVSSPRAVCMFTPLPDKPPPRVLLVDDAPEFRLLTRRFIQLEWPNAVVTDYDPMARGFPGEGFDWAAHDVVLLDYQMGPHDGMDWLQRLVANPAVPPIIFITGTGSENVAARAIKQGAVDYVSKLDLSWRRLVDAISEAATRNHARQVDIATADAGEGFPVREPVGAHALRIGIAGYRMLRALGEGGMAAVFLAEHVATGEQRVLKILDARASADDEFYERFLQEYATVSRIDSRHVVRIYDQGMSAQHAYIAMEYLPGGTLKARIDPSGMPAAVAMTIFRQLLAALKSVHAAGIVHRDLKPDNLMFRQDDSLALVDFGIAKEMDGILVMTQAGSVVGTPMYLSPEQGAGLPVDYRSDLYSAGVLLYEMLTGKLPFEANTISAVIHMHQTAPIPLLPHKLAHYQVLINKLMAKDPNDRFQSAAALMPEGS